METAVLVALRARGVDCSSPTDAGLRGRADETQLEHAASIGSAIVTSNQGDFSRLHWQWVEHGRTHAGIVILTARGIPIGVVVEKLARLATGPEEIATNELAHINAAPLEETT